MTPRDTEQTVLRQLEERSSRTLDDIRQAIRLKSVSKTGEGLDTMADWLVSYIEHLGGTARRHPGVHFPIIEGELASPSATRTLLFYELYDTQPASPEGWICPPFEPATAELDGVGPALVGRGAFNSKGPLVAFLAVLAAFHESGTNLPVNLRFVIEGEEEIGSPSLKDYLQANAHELRQCDAAFIPYFSTDSRGRTALRLGFKGLMLLELSVRGGDWGGPGGGDIHAMHAPWIASPAWDLVHALASLEDRDGNLCLPGLREKTRGPDAGDRHLLTELAFRFPIDTFLEELEARRFRHDLPPAELYERLMFSPSLNIDSIAANPPTSGEEPATAIPQSARAFLDLRLVPDMDVDSTVRMLRSHLDAAGFEHVEMEIKNAYPWAKVSASSEAVQCLFTACQRHADSVAYWPIHQGAAPLYLFSQLLGLPFAVGGLGHGGRSHAVNEYITLEGLDLFQRSMASFLIEFGTMSDAHD